MDGGLGEVERALGQPHPIDRASRCVGDQQRLRVGVADVLRGEDDHAAGDEARVLAALQHHRQVVERGVDVGAAGRLDPGRYEVVVAVALAVVVERLALQGVLDRGDADRLAPRPLNRPLQGGEGDAGVAAAATREHLQRRVLDRRRIGEPPLRVGQRPPQQRLHLLRLQRLQLVDLAAGEQRRVDLEVGVLGGRPDQGQQPLLDRRQQRVLLGLVEAMDLVEEEDGGPPAPPPPLPGPFDHSPNLSPPHVDSRLLLKGSFGPGRRDPGQRRLPRPRRPVEDGAVRMPVLDRRPQSGPRAKHMLLPDQLVQAPRPHSHRQGSIGSFHPNRAGFLAVEQAIGHQR